MSRRRAVGIHVFAGGFTHGVDQVFDVDAQLEIHDFGRESVEQVWKKEFINEHTWELWPEAKGIDFAYGNPRCTGFSTITAGLSEDTHGPWAKQTCDIWDFCRYVTREDIPICIWESVQQAFSTGRPMLDALRDDIFVPNGYRIAHILLNYASCGNTQQRKRYFFVAYKADGGTFNIVPPELPNEYKLSVYDAIWDLRERESNIMHPSSPHYDRDSFYDLTAAEWHDIEYIPPTKCLNSTARNWWKRLCSKHQKTWNDRTSDMPFSMHCPRRLWWTKQSPTLHSSASRFLHPRLHRPLTLGELSAIMGWPEGVIPAGRAPVAQLAKGVVPEAGKWLAEQAMNWLDGMWKDEPDWESSYSHTTNRWEGRVFEDEAPVEKVFNMNQFFGKVIDLSRFDPEVFELIDKTNVNTETGSVINPWVETKGMESGKARDRYRLAFPKLR